MPFARIRAAIHSRSGACPSVVEYCKAFSPSSRITRLNASAIGSFGNNSGAGNPPDKAGESLMRRKSKKDAVNHKAPRWPGVRALSRIAKRLKAAGVVTVNVKYSADQEEVSEPFRCHLSRFRNEEDHS